ncbi:MAG: Rep family protein [Candidatus Nitrosoglobus sp.]|jgi:hypothetical protein
MNKQPSSTRNIMLVNQLEFIDLNLMLKVLETKENIREWAYIVHNKDIKEGEVAKPHLHLLVKLWHPQSFDNIAKWFNQPAQYLEGINGSWITACRYLIHANDETKYQYSPDEVVSNFDYKQSISLERVKKKANKFKAKEEHEERKLEIIKQCANGTIRKFNYHDYITPVE